MSAVLPTIVPVFGLILLGYLAGRTGYLSEAGIKGLPEFVFRIAMPVMLFRTIGAAKLPDIAPWSILAAFFGALALTWIVSVVGTTLLLRRSQADAAAHAMGSTFSNSVMMGIPICLAHFGPDAAPILALIVLFDTSILWLVATLHLSAAEGTARNGVFSLLGSLGWRLITNPVIAGTVAGLLWQIGGFSMPPLARTMVDMLANAAIPGALVAMGLALNSYGLAGQMPAVAMMTGLKLVVMPVAAYVTAVLLLGLSPLAAGIVMVLAAMPVGANAYLFAAAYNREPGAVSGAIALSTPLSLVTLTLLLLVLGR